MFLTVIQSIMKSKLHKKKDNKGEIYLGYVEQ